MAALANSKVQYVGSVEWAAVPAYPGAGSVAAGTLCTNTANSPALGSERCFVCTIAGVTLGTAPTFTVTKGALTEDSTTGIYWQECTGQPGVNGDITNSPVWGANLSVVKGQIIYDSGTASLQIAGSSFTTHNGAAPTFSATAGTTSTGQDVGLWTSLGLASAFGPWAAPHKRILNADAATWQTVVPATIYISSDPGESNGSTSMTLAGGQGIVSSLNRYLSVSSAAAPPTSCTAGAGVATTTTGTITVNGSGYYYGITFSCGSSTSNGALTLSAGTYEKFENCTFILGGTSSSAVLWLSQGAGQIDYLNCTFVFGATGQSLVIDEGNITVINGVFAATGSAPSTLITSNNANGVTIIRDSDLSNITGTLINLQNCGNIYILENCKLAAGVAITKNTTGADVGIVKLHNCDSGSKNYRFYETNGLGTIQQETTIVDNTNPASNGNETYSWNIATSANAAFGQPYVSPEIAQWNALTSSSHTATIQINSNVNLNNAQIWMELEYLGSSATPLGSVVSSRVADAITSPTTLSSSADSWGGSETYQQYMSVTFSPKMAGYIKVRIYVADPSITVYVSPIILVV